MTIIDFLEKNQITLSTFAKACEIPLSTMQTYLKQSEPCATNCRIIITQSHGAIKLEDLSKTIKLH